MSCVFRILTCEFNEQCFVNSPVSAMSCVFRILTCEFNELCFDNSPVSSMSCVFRILKVKVKALFIYIADRKASAYSWHFFCSTCFQLSSTTTGTLLLIRRPWRVSCRVDHRHLHTRTHLVVQGVRTLCQWHSLPKTGTIWRSYCHELDLSQPTN